MKKPFAILFSAAALSIVGACSKNPANANATNNTNTPAPAPVASAAGTYELDKTTMKDAMMAVPAEQKANAEMMKAMEAALQSMSITVDLKADHTASVTTKGMMGDATETGTWKLDGTKLTLTTKDKAGKEDVKTGDYAGTSFTVTDEMEPGKPMKMTFKKK